jgi:cysteine synthase B
MPSAIVPRIYDSALADQNLEISTEAAYKMVKRLARQEAILVGISAAAALVGCLKVAENLKRGQGGVIVTILCDSGDKYLSERFWDET